MIITDPKRVRDLAIHMFRAHESEDRPIVAHLDITYRCDLDCEHCYLTDKQWPELTTVELKAVLDQLRSLGVIRIQWSGGEVFTRPDFPELLRYAASLGFMNNVKTHAGHVTPERAAMMAGYGVFRMDVSIYSLRDEVHDEVTRMPGSLQASLVGMKNALDAGIAVRAAVVIFQKNSAEVEELDRYFRDMGCDVSFNSSILSDNNASTHLDGLRLTPEQLDDVNRRRLGLRVAAGEDVTVKPEFNVDDNPCGAGGTLIYIAPDGAVWPCVNFPMSLGNVREEPLVPMWETSDRRAELRQFTNANRTDCASCSGATVCAYCVGEAFSRTGDYRNAPAVFHADTRSRMHGLQANNIKVYSDDEWQTVPESAPAPQSSAQGRKFVFPIYRKQKRQGRRVNQVTAAAGCSTGCPD